MKRLLFVCYGNSCRSQMAEAWARQFGEASVEAVSAGIHPLGYITDETEQVMAERGVALDGQASKGLDECDLSQVDVVVNMSGHPLEAQRAEFRGRWLEWAVDDPFGEGLDVYRRVRDELGKRVRNLVDDLRNKSQALGARLKQR